MTLSQKIRGFLQALLQMGEILNPGAACRRRLEKRTKAAAESLIDVGGVVMPFKYLVATGLTARGVPAERVPADTIACIRDAVAATTAWRLTLWLRRRSLIKKVELDSMRWRTDDVPHAVGAATRARERRAVRRHSGVR